VQGEDKEISKEILALTIIEVQALRPHTIEIGEFGSGVKALQGNFVNALLRRGHNPSALSFLAGLAAGEAEKAQDAVSLILFSPSQPK
jgi:hypothetical protein